MASLRSWSFIGARIRLTILSVVLLALRCRRARAGFSPRCARDGQWPFVRADGLPQLPRRQPRALDEAREPRPDDIRVHGRLADPRAESTVSPGDDLFAAHESRLAGDPLGDPLLMLDQVRRPVDYVR